MCMYTDRIIYLLIKTLRSTVTTYFFPYPLFLPKSNGIYRYLIICLFISSAQEECRKSGSLLDLPAHSQSKEGQEVDQEDGPVYWDIGGSGNGT